MKPRTKRIVLGEGYLGDHDCESEGWVHKHVVTLYHTPFPGQAQKYHLILEPIEGKRK